MWKLAFVGSCLLFCLIEAQDGTPVPGHGALKGYCNTNSDCGKKECCVSFATSRGKVAVAEPSAYIKQFAKGKCEKHGKSGSGTCEKHCSSCADCAPSECCVSSSAVRGKRFPHGHCKPMGKRGSECLVSNGSGRPHQAVFHSCPCKTPLTCVWTGKSEVTLGNLGRCEQNKGY